MELISTEELRHNSIFDGLSKEQVELVLPCILYSVKDYGTEECICDKGQEPLSIGVVVDGSIAIRDDGASRKNVMESIEKNGVFGEMTVFSTSGALSHRMIADKNTRILFLSKDFFVQPCSKECGARNAHIIIIKNMLRLISDKALYLDKKIAYLSAPDLKTKIAMYLCELREATGSTSFTMPLNRDRLAEFFSVARPSLSRELVNLKNSGVINFRRSMVEILDIDALYSMARYD